MKIAQILAAGPGVITTLLAHAISTRWHFSRAALIGAALALLPPPSVALPIDEVLESGEFRLFSTALKTAGLWDRIISEEGVTLFAISDKALRDEGSAFLLEKVLLTQHNQQRLRNLMLYHVYFGMPLLSNDIQREVRFGAETGPCLSVSRSGSGIRVGPEAVVTDVKQVNSGIIYVIDRLLWQPWQGQGQPWQGQASCHESRSRAP